MAKMTAAQALSAQLASIPAYLQPRDQAAFKLLRGTAARISPTGGSYAAGVAATIYQMSGAAGGYGDLHPPTAVNFPADHHLHLDCGNEWYWISCNLEAQGPDGPVKIALLIDMLRIRVVSKANRPNLDRDVPKPFGASPFARSPASVLVQKFV